MVRLQIKIGEWTATPALNLLENGQQSTKLEPRAMEMLAYLAQHAGDVVSVDQFIADLWKGRAADDALVYKRINQLRKALGDNSRAPRFIETIPKRGYRLIAPVDFPDENQRVLEPVGETLADIAPTGLSSNRSIRSYIGSRRSLKAAAIISSTIFCLAVLYLGLFSTPSVENEDHRSVAVLPFTSLSTETEDDYFFVDGMHDVLLAHLAKIKDLKVISRTSVMAYQNSGKSVREIGSELNVASVLEGTVQRIGDNIRINIQLIDAETEEYLWAELYDRRLTAENLFAIQSEMATAVARTLQAMLSPAEAARLSAMPTHSTRAYDFYLLGEEYMRRVPNETWTPLATQMYEQAIAEDPQFALAWAALARAHIVTYDNGLADSSDGLLEKARSALERAFEMAPDSPEVLLSMARYHQGVGAFDEALQEFEIAERSLPGGSYLYRSRANVFQKMGQYEKAIADMNRAIELDPLNIEQLETQATSYIMLRDYENAGDILDRILEMRPDLGSIYIDRAIWLPLVKEGTPPVSDTAFSDPRLLDMNADETYYVRWLAALYARDYEAALGCLDEWNASDENTDFRKSHIPLLRGVIHTLTRDDTRARQQFLLARDEIEHALLEAPDDPRLLTMLGQALAGLGEFASAKAVTLKALDLFPDVSAPTVLGSPTYPLLAATALVAAGEHERAIDQLDLYLRNPGQWSLRGLLQDPRLDSIRNHPRIDRLFRNNL